MANQFLIKETMAKMKELSTSEITALQNGTYDGVQLLGYHKKGDTPAPIIYHYVDLLKDPDPGPDDGGSVIVVGGIKLFHNYVGDINLLYFGRQEGQVLNSYLTKALRITANTGSFTIIPKGSFLIDRSYTPVFNARIKGIDRNLTKIILNPATATNSGAF